MNWYAVKEAFYFIIIERNTSLEREMTADVWCEYSVPDSSVHISEWLEISGGQQFHTIILML